MRIDARDFIVLAFGAGVAILCYYADLDVGVFVGGAWVGAFLFKLGYICEKRWGKKATNE